ncbi:hypothetical protein [Actinomadura hibisca]|uniref:hypothetical protein n=1 Tax=Actinomadura hibisca TaxID=68565 RepID=UPI0008323127|nr:hypothetical protein [Actinomadura hibisca]
MNETERALAFHREALNVAKEDRRFVVCVVQLVYEEAMRTFGVPDTTRERVRDFAASALAPLTHTEDERQQG